MRELVWLASFETDVQAEYERREELQPDAGDVFYVRLRADLGQLAYFPLSGARLEQTALRRLLVLRRRFAVIYVPEARRIMLHLLLDQVADPAFNARRIRSVMRRLKRKK